LLSSLEIVAIAADFRASDQNFKPGGTTFTPHFLPRPRIYSHRRGENLLSPTKLSTPLRTDTDTAIPILDLLPDYPLLAASIPSTPSPVVAKIEQNL
jgi:hypothetical protein